MLLSGRSRGTKNSLDLRPNSGPSSVPNCCWIVDYNLIANTSSLYPTGFQLTTPPLPTSPSFLKHLGCPLAGNTMRGLTRLFLSSTILFFVLFFATLAPGALSQSPLALRVKSGLEGEITMVAQRSYSYTLGGTPVELPSRQAVQPVLLCPCRQPCCSWKPCGPGLSAPLSSPPSFLLPPLLGSRTGRVSPRARPSAPSSMEARRPARWCREHSTAPPRAPTTGPTCSFRVWAT